MAYFYFKGAKIRISERNNKIFFDYFQTRVFSATPRIHFIFSPQRFIHKFSSSPAKKFNLQAKT